MPHLIPFRRGLATPLLFLLAAFGCHAGLPATRCPVLPALSEAAFACAVDRAAQPAADNASPKYPSMLAGGDVEGIARVRFIVRADGSVDSASVQVIGGWSNLGASFENLPHDLFALSVARTVRRWRFKPAERSGHPIAQYVVQEFQFRLTPDPDSTLASACRAHISVGSICVAARSARTVYGTVTGWLVEGEPAQPVVGASVIARDSADPRQGWSRVFVVTKTDAAGHFRLDSLPRGPAQLAVQCEHRLKMVAFETVVGYVHVSRDSTISLELRSPAGECIAPPADTVRGVFRGEAALGFELNSFISRSSGEGGIEFSPRALRQFQAREHRGRTCKTDSGWEYGRYDIAFVGRKIAPMQFGAQFWVDSVLAVRRPAKCELR